MNRTEIARMLNEPAARLDGRYVKQRMWELRWREPITKQGGTIISTPFFADYASAVSELLRLKRQHRKRIGRVGMQVKSLEGSA